MTKRAQTTLDDSPQLCCAEALLTDLRKSCEPVPAIYLTEDKVQMTAEENSKESINQKLSMGQSAHSRNSPGRVAQTRP